MDLPAIGAHCALPSCNELDLLPIQCYCDKLFCKKHIAPDSHDCPSGFNDTTKLSDVDLKILTSKRQKCAYQGCTKPSLESAATITGDDEKQSGERTPAVCSRCSFAFCAPYVYIACPGLVLVGPLCPNHLATVIHPHTHAQLQKNHLRRTQRHKLCSRNTFLLRRQALNHPCYPQNRRDLDRLTLSN